MTASGATAVRVPRGRRRSRPAEMIPLLLGVLLGLGALLWGVDRLVRLAAESALADALQEATGTVTTPTVEIGGGPVLLQALRGRYEDVTVTLEDVSNGPLTFDRVEAELSGVHLALHDVLLQDPQAVAVDGVRSEARLTHEALERYLRFTGRPDEVTSPGPGRLRIGDEGDVLGRPYSSTATVAVEAGTDALTVRPTDLRTVPEPDPAAAVLLRERFTFRVPLDPLPFRGTDPAVEVEDAALVVSNAGDGVVIRP